ncbi:hypothetical protein Nmel_018233 [Mimus melanotis]
MALGGDGFMAQAVPLTGREHDGGRGKTGKANAITLGLGAGNWEGPTSCWLLLTWIPWPPRGGLAAHGGGHHNRASLILHPSDGTAGDMGSRETWCREGLGSGGPMAGATIECQALQSCSVWGHGKYSRVQLLQGCWSSASGFFQVS